MSPLIQQIQQKLTTLSDIRSSVNKHERVAACIYTRMLKCQLGSLTSCLAISCNKRIPPEALRLFVTGAGHDIASRLKLASALYNNGNYQTTAEILNGLERRFLNFEIAYLCKCYPNRNTFTLNYILQVCESSKEKDISKTIAYCVMFTPHEIHCAPPALRTEMYKTVGEHIQYRDIFDNSWKALAVSDSLPFLYYLQFLTYGQLGQRHVQLRALQNLELCTKHDICLRHRETAWNILGQCMELEDNNEAALSCYRTSLEVRLRNNAAHWHLQKLCHRNARGRNLAI